MPRDSREGRVQSPKPELSDSEVLVPPKRDHDRKESEDYKKIFF